LGEVGEQGIPAIQQRVNKQACSLMGTMDDDGGNREILHRGGAKVVVGGCIRTREASVSRSSKGGWWWVLLGGCQAVMDNCPSPLSEEGGGGVWQCCLAFE